MLSNVTIPLVGAVDVAMMGRLDDPVFIGGVGLGMIVFNFIYFGLGFLRMGTTGLVAQMYGTGQDDKIAFLLIRGITLAFGLGGLFILASPFVSMAALYMFSASDMAEQLMTDYISQSGYLRFRRRLPIWFFLAVFTDASKCGLVWFCCFW